MTYIVIRRIGVRGVYIFKDDRFKQWVQEPDLIVYLQDLLRRALRQ